MKKNPEDLIKRKNITWQDVPFYQYGAMWIIAGITVCIAQWLADQL